jgi:hypothetical protein
LIMTRIDKLPSHPIDSISFCLLKHNLLKPTNDPNYLVANSFLPLVPQTPTFLRPKTHCYV